MSTHSVSERLDAIAVAIDRFLPPYVLAVLNGTIPNLDQVDELVAVMEGAQQKLTQLVTLPPMPSRTPAQRCQDIITAVEGIVASRGAILLQTDALHSQVVAHCPREAQAFWARQPEPKVTGVLLNEPEVMKELNARGVIAWWHEPDRNWRIVNTRWRVAHAEIRSYVMAAKRPGRVCRFCDLIDAPTGQDFVLHESKRPGPLATANGATQVEAVTVQLHPQCLPYWDHWVSIANSYPGQEAAQAADEAAGRSTPLAVLPEVTSHE